MSVELPASRCRNCGFSASPGEGWSTVEVPKFGTMTRCPECGSTDVMTGQ